MNIAGRYKEIATKLKSARIAAGYATAHEFSRKHNLPVATYYQHESGKRYPKIDAIKKYSRLLKIDVNTFNAPIFDRLLMTIDFSKMC